MADRARQDNSDPPEPAPSHEQQSGLTDPRYDSAPLKNDLEGADPAPKPDDDQEKTQSLDAPEPEQQWPTTVAPDGRNP